MILSRESKPGPRVFDAVPGASLGPGAAAGDAPRFIERLFRARGIDPERDTELLLPADYTPPEPSLLEDMDKTINLLDETLRGDAHIGVFIHDDTDGFCSAAILKRAFLRAARLMGSSTEVHVYVPNCLQEGHGFSRNALDFFESRGIPLIVTADIGITDHEMIDIARGMGFKVIVTDHHKISRGLPPADTVVDPLRGGYPHNNLCGASVSLKLASALLSSISPGENLDSELLPFAALGTLADMSPLLGENRYIVSRGVTSINAGNVPVILEMMRNLGISGQFDEFDLADRLAPLLNAGFSSGGINPSLDLLDRGFDRDVFENLRQLLEEKDNRIDTAYSLAASRIDLAAASETGFIGVFDGDIPPSTPGAVAGRIVKNYGMPALVVGRKGSMAVGEVRTNTELDWVDALDAAKDLLESYGGHPRAAGFSTPWSRIERINGRIVEYFKRHSLAIKPVRVLEIDFEFDLAMMNRRRLGELERLRPFGSFNPLPAWRHDGLLEIESISGASTLKVEATGLELEFADDRLRSPFMRAASQKQPLSFVYTPASSGSTADITILELIQPYPA